MAREPRAGTSLTLATSARRPRSALGSGQAGWARLRMRAAERNRDGMAAPALPTPRYDHVGPDGPFGDVYEPAEDTFLLLDALEQDADRLREAR